MSRKSTGKSGTSLLALRAPALGGSGGRSIAVVACVAIALLALFASAALAAETHPYTGVSFGPDGVGGSQNFQGVRSITVDPANGDVYVYDAGAGSIYKFDSAGAPKNFSSTGTNAITGVGGGGGSAEYEIALAPAGSPGGTAGDIYAATNGPSVQIYSPSGEFLGEVAQGGETCGVATDPGGHLYAGVYSQTINKYTPDANPPTEANKEVGTIEHGICNVAADGLGNVYAANFGGGGLFKIEGISGTTPVEVDSSASTMAVAPGTNDLYADRGEEIVVYDPAGAKIGAFGSAELSQSRGIGVNSGESKIYVGTSQEVMVYGPMVTVPDATTEAATGISKASTTLHGTIGAAGGPDATCSFQYATEAGHVEHGFQGASEAPCSPAGPFTGAGTTAVTATVTGLTTETNYVFRLRGTNENGNNGGQALTFATPDAVIVATAPATALADHSATLNGTVNPEGTELEKCSFEYGTGTSPESIVPCAETPAQIGSGNSPFAVHADLAGLHAGTEYFFHIVGKNEFGTNGGTVETFKTDGPTIEAQSAASVKSDGVTLRATINPNGEPTTYHFEYVDDASFQTNGFAGAAKTPVPDGAVGASIVSETVSAEISGLTAGMLYHFRVVANSAAGTAEGDDETFATYPATGPFSPCGNEALRYGYGVLLPDCRAYEQATPVNKNGTNALASYNTVQAGSSGGAIAFWTPAGVPGGKGAGQLTNYAAFRGTAGWSTVGLLPPASLGQFTGSLGWTPDLRYAISDATELNISGDGLFIQNTSDGSIATMVPYATGGEAVFNYVGSSSDDSKVFFEAEVREGGAPLTPEAAPGENNLYVWDRGTGDVSLVGVLPSSVCGASPCAPAGGSFAGPYNWQEQDPTNGGAKGRFYTQALNTVSSDGSKAYFTAGQTGEVFLRRNPTSPSATTVQISASQKTNGSGTGGTDPHGPRPAAFMIATPDGSKAFFTSPEELTNDATTGPADNGRDLYSFEAASGRLTDLVPDTSDPDGAEVMGVIGTSDDGSHVYFAANGDLDGAGPATPGNCGPEAGAFGEWGGECSLYLWEEGRITFIARLDASGSTQESGPSDATNWAPHSVSPPGLRRPNTGRVSASGDVVVFRSHRKLTSYDNRGVPEYYRYDASSGSLDCITCNPSNVAPVGVPFLQVQTSVLGVGGPAAILTRNLSSSGDQFFFQTADALLPSDTNGLADVYEWEADGAGSCQTSSEDGGCIYLISTGTSTEPSYIADTSPSGDEVFFFTEQPLVGQDEDNLVDVYDARVEGGLAGQNPQRAPACSGEACKGPSTQPAVTKGAASAVFQGPGNAAGQVACVAAPTIKRLTKSAKSLRGQARKLKGKAKKASTTKQTRKLNAKARGLSKSATAHEKRAQKLTKGCSGVGGKGAR
jgi:hypothetical protein